MIWPLDTIGRRWDMLAPHVRAFGPPDEEPRPAVILFHGCAGVRPHMDIYARDAAREGFRAFVIDSYEPRGWAQSYATAVVCSGAMFWGRERAGDVLAAVWGLAQDPGVDASRINLAGWSHGAWSIMDLMTMPLERSGEAGLADPSARPLQPLKGLFLAYPYGGLTALSRDRDWVRRPRTLAVLGEKDRVTHPRDAQRIYDRILAGGCQLEVWRAPGRHAFDEAKTELSWLRHDRGLAAASVARFGRFLAEALGHA